MILTKWQEKQAKERKAVCNWCECHGHWVSTAASGPVLQQGTAVLSWPHWCWESLQSAVLCWVYRVWWFTQAHLLLRFNYLEKKKSPFPSKRWSFLIHESSLHCAFDLLSTSGRQCIWGSTSLGSVSLAFMSYWHDMSPALAPMPISTPALRKSWLSRRWQQRRAWPEAG